VGPLALAGVLVIGLNSGSAVLAQGQQLKLVEPAAKRDDAQARALFDQVATAYQALTVYSDQGEFVIATTAEGKSQKQVLPIKLTFVRPNKLDLDAGPIRVTSDGTTLTTAAYPLKRYTAVPAPPVIAFDTFREGQIGALLFGGPAGTPMYVLLNLMTAADPASAVAQLGGTFQRSPTPVPDPKSGSGAKPASTKLLIDFGEARSGMILTVDPASKLLTSIQMKIDPLQLARGLPTGQTVSLDQFGWNSGPVATQLPKDRSFAFEIPKDFTKVDAVIGQQQRPAVDEKLGKPAPNFVLTVLDGPGKSKTLTKAELAGKIVVIDFWATWCRPCLMELPEIQKLVESYANAQKDVIVIALSQDSEPAELSEVRRLVEKTLSENEIKLTSGSAGLIGLDPSKSVGEAFQIEGYPSVVILDTKGIVQAIHVGFDPDTPLNKSLAKEIDEIRAGKPPAASKIGAKEASKKEDKPTD
jgi:thiol-disulfide isomerase/thioredoxin